MNQPDEISAELPPQPERAAGNPTGHFTTSLGLLERLPQLKIGFDVVAILDLMTIALLVGLLFTRFVVLPGVRVDLPKTELRMPQNASNVAVLTIGNQGMLFFAGGVYEIDSIERAFQRYMAVRNGDGAVVLLKAQASIDLQMFLDLCQMAQEAGFDQVQISGQKVEAVSELIPAGSVGESTFRLGE